MAFDPDAYLADKEAPAAGGFDPDAYLASRGDPAADKPVSALSGPGARAPEVNPGLNLRDQPKPDVLFPSGAPKRFVPGSHEEQEANAALRESLRLPRGERENPLANDIIGQGIVTGLPAHGASVLAGTALKALGAPAAVERIGAAAVGGGTASKLAGGDFGPGALLGAAFPAAGALARRAGAVRNLTKEVTKGATKAPAKQANEVKFRAREEGGTLHEVLAEVPEARRAVMTQAKTNPGAAEKTLTKVVDDATDLNSADFAAMQRQHGGVNLAPINDQLKGLEERLNLQGRGVAADAVGRFRRDLLKPKRYGLEGKVLTDEQIATQKIGAQSLRNIRNDLGEKIQPANGKPIRGNNRRFAEARIMGVINKEIEDVAANTRGVDVNALRTRNRQISTLIPVRDALRARAESQAELPLTTKLKKAPGQAIRRGVRELTYDVGELPDVSPVAPIGAFRAVDRE